MRTCWCLISAAMHIKFLISVDVYRARCSRYKMITYSLMWNVLWLKGTVYPKKYAHGFCFAVLCCGYTLTDFPISIRLTSPALWQSNDCPSASKATLMNMDKYFMWIHYERLHNHNKAKHNKTVCIFLWIYCIYTLLEKIEWPVICHALYWCWCLLQWVCFCILVSYHIW